ncbi:SDR family NAD(P)-dependent oxidoreductase [Tersicoccus sp. Bi-70]|uniref:SDR family NAD(P)-dependent oxidoreductase n=1 Tax=Tersicoccus sp. Bi-70 TaxID=1897634 RepID=UPI000978493F|nr:SDR family oxidoreductase [Tersicoccus sp. Bi-70]OMH37086.1 3-oxoacyl-ACP reductase [Tersicoccus sp. Bi-70]
MDVTQQPQFAAQPLTALVTGASGGIGRATCVALAERGHRIAVHWAVNDAGARQTLASLAGAGHVLVRGDLTEPGAAERIVSEAIAALGPLGVLVNNAAIATGPENRHHPAESDFSAWSAAFAGMIDVNLRAAADVSYWFARSAIDGGHAASVVNVGSRGAFRGEPEHPAYAATKAALHALGQSLAVALAPHRISVTSVAPGFTATERTADRLAGAAGDAIAGQSPFGRVARAEEIAHAIAQLADPASAWASGTILDLNGASYLRS